MQFKIEWKARVGPYRLSVSSIEKIEAKHSTACLSKLRGSIITKLDTLNTVYFIESIRFINIGYPIQISTCEQYMFLNSLNEEGGLVSNVPKEPPQKIHLAKDEDGNIIIGPAG